MAGKRVTACKLINPPPDNEGNHSDGLCLLRAINGDVAQFTKFPRLSRKDAISAFGDRRYFNRWSMSLKNDPPDGC
jgi:hypothetical protein